MDKEAQAGQQDQPAVVGQVEPSVRPHSGDWMSAHEAERLAALWCAGQPLDDLPQWRTAMQVLVRELADTRAALKKANDMAEHFERLWYLTNEDAARYHFAKTLEGQVVTMETFKVRGAADLDQALDDAMAEAADAQNEAGYAA